MRVQGADVKNINTSYLQWYSSTGATTFTSQWIPLATYLPDGWTPPPAKRKPEPVNPYLVDPDARHLERIRAELAAPWPPPKAK
jgi:hypothetical protein